MKIKEIWATFIKGIKYPEGRYETCCGISSRKGETCEELFSRRDRHIQESIILSYPIMTFSEYYKIPISTDVFPHRLHASTTDSSFRDKIGVITDKDESGGIFLKMVRFNDED